MTTPQQAAAVRDGPDPAGAQPAPARRGPVDPRLWRHSPAARRYLGATVLAGAVTAVTVLISATLIGTVLAGVITDPDKRTVGAWSGHLVGLAAVIAVRVAATWAQARYGHRSGLQVVAELKSELLTASAATDPRTRATRREELAAVLTRGLDDLRPYLTGYLPALMLAVTVTPAALVLIAIEDLTAAIIAVITLPLIPIFMILIGLLTRGKARTRLRTMAQLSAQLLDLIAGLPTLRALGRERGPAARVRELGDAHRRSTMAALRYAFLSSMVLELLATLSVALIAVSIGMRLVYGNMTLTAGMIALILAPEVYLPLREVGTRFHAAEDGLEAADAAFGALGELGAGQDGDGTRADARSAAVPDGALTIRLDHVTVTARRGTAPHGLTAVARPGRITALTGPNGSGKSTALATVLGLLDPTCGAVTVTGAGGTATPVADLGRDTWWSQLAWLPQRPVLLPGTIAENLALGRRTGPAGQTALDDAAAATGFDRVLADLPAGTDTRLTSGGEGLSLGQRQRLALTRTLAADARVLLLDEPTAHLDAEAEARVLTALRARAEAGATVLIIGHRPAVLAAADTVITVASGPEPAAETGPEVREVPR